MDNVSLLVGLTVAVNVNLHQDLMRFSVTNITRIEAETVLTAEHSINRVENVGQFAFESYRVIAATGLFRKGLQNVVRLDEAHAVEWDTENVFALSGVEKLIVFLQKEIAGSNDINRHA